RNGGVRATAGGPVEAYRTTGPVLDLGDGSYVTPIIVRTVNPNRSSPSVGRFWLTDLAGAPSANLPPMLLRGPMDVLVSRRTGFREPVVLSAVVQSGTAVEFRWFLNDAQIEGQTNALLMIPDPQPGHSGRYRLEAANSLGMVKAEALVTVVVPPPEAPRLSAEWIPGERPLRLRFQPITGYHYRLESSGDLISWTPLEDPAAVISPNEFAPQVGNGPGYYRLLQEP
ncbi:MAG: Immunoglobulin I-set domain, partial [Verrucomicrobiota bacterium]